MNNTWSKFIKEEFKKDYFIKINNEINKNEIIFPPKKLIYKVFDMSLEKIKVIILGQDPYYKKGQAHGLSFSVHNNIKIPSSLNNVYKEIENEYGEIKNKSGNLEKWENQGVFLLNSILTVVENKPSSHKKIGWQFFTNNVINYISDNTNNNVFMLWGDYAKGKEYLINNKKHLILKSAHPSGLSAYRGFLGNNHFKLCNEYLKKNNKEEINWNC